MVLACVVLVEVDGATCSRFPVRYYCTDRLSVSARIIFPNRHFLLATMRYDFFHKALHIRNRNSNMRKYSRISIHGYSLCGKSTMRL